MSENFGNALEARWYRERDPFVLVYEDVKGFLFADVQIDPLIMDDHFEECDEPHQ
jgi:hypothetical protein